MKIQTAIDVRKYIIPLGLSLLYMTIYLSSTSVAYKLVQIGPAIEPGPPFIFPISYAIANIVAEVYGSSLVKALIWLTLACEILYACFVKLIISLPSPTFWNMQQSYENVFGHVLQFVLSGACAVLASSFINVYLLVKIKTLTDGRHFWLRSMISSSVGGLALVAIIIVFGYLPIEGYAKAMQMFIPIYSLELAYAALLVMPSWLICKILKKVESFDVFDYDVKFNPFKF